MSQRKPLAIMEVRLPLGYTNNEKIKPYGNK